MKPGMLGTDARIIEPSRNRVGFGDLAVVVHQEISAVAMQHARPAAFDGGGMHAAVEAVAGGFDAVNFDVLVIEERMKQAHGIGSRRRCRR